MSNYAHKKCARNPSGTIYAHKRCTRNSTCRITRLSCMCVIRYIALRAHRWLLQPCAPTVGQSSTTTVSGPQCKDGFACCLCFPVRAGYTLKSWKLMPLAVCRTAGETNTEYAQNQLCAGNGRATELNLFSWKTHVVYRRMVNDRDLRCTCPSSRRSTHQFGSIDTCWDVFARRASNHALIIVCVSCIS